jgi:hypothetical protein
MLTDFYKRFNTSKMSRIFKSVIYLVIGFLFTSWILPPASNTNSIAVGHQPQISMDNSGIVRVVSGNSDSIYCTTSLNKGITFGKPVLVGIVKKMHLGMARGPQLASSDHYSVITAIDETGDIHFFMLAIKKEHGKTKVL